MLVLALLATPSAASRPPTWRGEALIFTHNYGTQLPTDAPALALAAAASCKPNNAAQLLLREDDLTWEGAALFGAWPDATFHQNFSFPVKSSKPTGAASRAAGPTTLKHIGAAADAEFASFDEIPAPPRSATPHPRRASQPRPTQRSRSCSFSTLVRLCWRCSSRRALSRCCVGSRASTRRGWRIAATQRSLDPCSTARVLSDFMAL